MLVSAVCFFGLMEEGGGRGVRGLGGWMTLRMKPP